MANSIKEYTTVSSALTSYTTPPYINETDIKVYLDDVLLTEGYVISGQSLNFMHPNVPQTGQALRIERVSETTSRLVDYTDGSLLNAETLDKDATQIFHVAQEAYDQARVTNMAAGQFYYSQVDTPTDPVAGTLWYNKSKSPNVLEIYDGSDWYPAAPVKDVTKLTQADVVVSDQGLDQFAYSGYNASSEVFLNGVKLIKGYDAADITNGDGDYFELHGSLVVASLTATDVLEVITYSGGYSNVIEDAINQFNDDNAVITAKIDDVEPKVDDVIALDIPTKISQITQLVDNAETHEDNAEDSAEAAAASAAEAREVAYGSQDTLEGWAALDNEAITTTSANDPIIYSNGTLTLKADEGIYLDGAVNFGDATTSDIRTPVVNGYIDVANDTWHGTSGVTLTKPNGTSLAKFELTHADINRDTGMYVANVTMQTEGQRSDTALPKVENHTNKLVIWSQLRSVGTAAFTNYSEGYIFVEIYKFD